MDILDYIEPIPLTEDWLLKFGFAEEYNSDMVKFWHNSFVTIYHECYLHSAVDNLEWFFLSSSDFGKKVRIKYVHQLQNLFFCFTEKELNHSK